MLMFANEVLAALVVKDSAAGADALGNASHAESKVNKKNEAKSSKESMILLPYRLP